MPLMQTSYCGHTFMHRAGTELQQTESQQELEPMASFTQEMAPMPAQLHYGDLNASQTVAIMEADRIMLASWIIVEYYGLIA